MGIILTFPVSPTSAAAPTPMGPASVPVNVSADVAAARDALITKQLPLVRFVAGRMRHYANPSSGLEFDDLVGFGTEGLIHAADTYSPVHHAAFSTWAILHIRTTIQDAVRRLDPVSRTVRAKNATIERASQEFAHINGAWPTTAQVASALGEPVAVVWKVQQAASQQTVPLDVVEDGSGEAPHASHQTTLADPDPRANPEAVLDTAETSVVLHEALLGLPARDQLLLREYYLLGKPMHRIATEFGVSESRISQLHSRALRQLREAYTAAVDDAPLLVA